MILKSIINLPLTHGEAWYERKQCEDEKKLEDRYIPDRMKYVNACRYYTVKLNIYWLEQERESTAEDIFGAYEILKGVLNGEM